MKSYAVVLPLLAVVCSAGPTYADALNIAGFMSAAQLALRMLCSRARINMKLLREGLLSKSGNDQAELIKVADEFSKSPLFIDDSSHLSIMELRAKARRVHAPAIHRRVTRPVSFGWT